jgi:phenylacetate-CoA ligase
MAWFHKYIFKSGQRWRNPSLEAHYRFLKETEKWSKQALEELQWKRLKEILNYAYNHSAYYKKKWDEAGVHPGDIRQPDDMKKIPVITKSELIKHNKDIHSKENFTKKFFSVTSGTTGESLSFWKDENADSWNRAAIFRGYSWYGVRPWDFNGYFWGFDFSFWKKIKIRIADWLVNRYRLFTYEEKAFEKFVRKMRNAVYLEGYSSAIYQTAKLINERGLPKPLKMKMVKGTSEKIYPYYMKEVEKAFGRKMIGEYGAAESGLIAFECPEGNLHMVSEGVYVEESEGKIIVTNLIMRSFPVIRYELGDYIKLKPASFKCSCGMAHPVIEEITGRIGKNVYGKRGIYPSLYFYYVFKNLEKNRGLQTVYQVVQKEKGKLDFYIMDAFNEVESGYLKEEIRKLFGDDMDFTVTVKKDLLSDKKAKFKDFISYIE